MRLRRISPILLAVAAVSAAGAASTASATSPTPYDGLIFRVTGQVYAGAGLATPGCPSNLPAVNDSDLRVTVIRSAGNGTRPTTGDLAVAFRNGKVVSLVGAATVPSGHLVLIPPPSSLRSCPPLATIASSPAGNVHPIAWYEMVCVPKGCGSGGTHKRYSGTGCAAIARTGRTTTATFQIGDCTPSAFPRGSK